MHLQISPARRVLEEYGPAVYEHPFGKACSRNALLNFFPSPIASDVKVLLLGCADLHTALEILSSKINCAQTLHIHINESKKCLLNVARSVAILKILSAPSFDPDTSSKDFDYLWSVWYDACWSESTATRFQQDIINLLAGSLPEKVTLNSEKTLKELKQIWKCWLSCLKMNLSNPLFTSKTLSDRLEFIRGFFEQGNNCDNQQPSNEVDIAVAERTFQLMGVIDYPRELRYHIALEAYHYLETGNSPLTNGDSECCINPSLLKPDGFRKWRVHPAACPFNGYLPLPISELEESCYENGFVTKYCQGILSLLIRAYQRQKERVTFTFYIGDPLEFCYEINVRFDAILCCHLAEKVGLANLVNALERRLSEHSDSSLLIELGDLEKSGFDASRYVEEALCIPLSVMPSLLGLKLIDPIDRIGSSTPPNSSSNSVCLTFKRTPPFRNVKIEIKPSWGKYFTKLGLKCFHLEGSAMSDDGSLKLYTPLTFLLAARASIERAGRANEPNMLRETLEGCNPCFRLTVETMGQMLWATEAILTTVSLNINENLMTGSKKNFWRHPNVKVYSIDVQFPQIDLSTFTKCKTQRAPLLRLVLMPSDILNMLDLKKPLVVHRLPDTHFLDNIRLDFQKTVDDSLGWIRVSFPMVSDHGLAETHSGIIIDFPTGVAILPIGRVKHLQEAPLDQLLQNASSEMPHQAVKSIMDNNRFWCDPTCIETEQAYRIRMVFNHPVDFDGLKWYAVSSHPCKSSHRYVLTHGHSTFCFDLPHPFYTNHLGIQYLSLSEVELTLSKALDEPWPIEFNNMPKCSVENLEPWPLVINSNCKNQLTWGCSELFTHLRRQFASPGKHFDPYPALTEIRHLIFDIFALAIREGHSFISIRCLTNRNISAKEALELEPDWYLNINWPLRRSPQGAPMLVISAFDRRAALLLIDKGDLTVEEVEEDAIRLYFSKIPDGTTVPSCLTFSSEAADLLRYILRRNSTKISPSEWQAKHFNQTKCGAWLATFLSPCYPCISFSFEQVQHDYVDKCLADMRSHEFCANCHRFSQKLKRCTVCQVSYYCDVDCQEADWKKHKAICKSLKSYADRDLLRY